MNNLTNSFFIFNLPLIVNKIWVKIAGTEICFEFMHWMKEKEVNQLQDISIRTIDKIERKEKQIKYLIVKFDRKNI